MRHTAIATGRPINEPRAALIISCSCSTPNSLAPSAPLQGIKSELEAQGLWAQAAALIAEVSPTFLRQ